MGVAGDAGLEPSDPAAEIARGLADQSDRVETASMIVLGGLAFFFGFLAYFRSRLQQAEGEGGWLTSTAYGGGLVTAAMLLVLVSMQLATTAVSGHSDAQVAKVFVVYEWNYVWVFAPPMIAFTLGASLGPLRRSAALDRLDRVPGLTVVADAVDGHDPSHGLGAAAQCRPPGPGLEGSHAVGVAGKYAGATLSFGRPRVAVCVRGPESVLIWPRTQHSGASTPLNSDAER